MTEKKGVEEVLNLPTFGIRHLQCFLLFCGITFAYAMRVNLSLAIVAMTDKQSTFQDFPEYAWSEKIKSLLLSSFFWGYITTQILGGYLSRRFGGKVTILVGVFTSSVLALLTPLCAAIGDWPLVFLVRVMQGMSQGMLFPTTHTLLSKWAPAEERATLGTYCYSGSQFGTVVMLASSGIIASSFLGWPGIFYISGGLGVIWALAWYHWGASSPSEHKSISIAEKNFIETSLSHDKDSKTTNGSTQTLPWAKVLISPKFLSLSLTQSAYTWSFWTILTQIPSYMKNVLGFDIKRNALLTSLPFLVMVILGFVFSGLAALVEKYKCLSLTHSRKLFNTISTWIPAVALIWLGYVDANQTQLAIILLIVAVGFSSAMHVGFSINHIDLAPNFAGIILGVANTFANIMSLLAPLTVGFIVSNVKNPFEWRIVFFIAAGYCFFGNLSFVIFGSAKVQPWNEPPIFMEPELKPLKKTNQQ